MFTTSTPITQEVHTGKPLRNCEAREVACFEAERAKDGQRIACGGAAYLVNGSVVLLDTVHNHCCLYDPSHINRAEIKLSSKPHSVTQMGQRRIAVSLPEENMIQVLEVGSVFRFERNVYTDWPCYALASAGDDKIVVCYMLKHNVEVVMINLDGDKKCTLYTCGETDIGQMRIAYDKLRKRTCVLEKNVGIHVLLKDGSERFNVSSRASFLNGIDYDQEGNLYFILKDRGNPHFPVQGKLEIEHRPPVISQVSVNGDHLHRWAFELPSPTALCFHPNGRDFLVANETGKIHFFKLQ